MSYQILTDTSSDFCLEEFKRFNVKFTPLTVTLNGNEIKDLPGNIDIKEFYKDIRGGGTASTTQISVQAFTAFFKETLDEGKDVFYFGLSSGLSGTCQSACIARDDLAPQYPERRIYVGKSTCVTMGEAVMLHRLCRARDEGASFDELIELFEKTQPNVQHRFTVDDLMYLFRGGRLSRASAVVGSILGIKPTLHVDPEGRLTSHGKVRGRKQSLDKLVEEMEELSISDTHECVAIVHGDCLQDAQYVMEKIKNRFTVKHSYINFLGPTVGAHSGPGTVALFFFGKERK